MACKVVLREGDVFEGGAIVEGDTHLPWLRRSVVDLAQSYSWDELGRLS